MAKKNAKQPGPRYKITLGGQKFEITKSEADRIGNFKACAGGYGYGQKRIRGENSVGVHVPRYIGLAVWYDENLIRHETRLSDEEAKQCYYCRLCGRYMGCDRCLDTSLLSEIECAICNEYANVVGYWHHGNIRKDRWDGLTSIEVHQQWLKKRKLPIIIEGKEVHDPKELPRP